MSSYLKSNVTTAVRFLAWRKTHEMYHAVVIIQKSLGTAPVCTNIIEEEDKSAALSQLEDLSKGLAVNITWEMTKWPLLANLPVQWSRHSCCVFNGIIFPKSRLVIASLASRFSYMCPHADKHNTKPRARCSTILSSTDRPTERSVT